ncbi:MAG: hypothetical protein JWO11_1190 [Nocardioides sp.]|nr:hypothetical protein [Nocardioides sp.]
MSGLFLGLGIVTTASSAQAGCDAVDRTRRSADARVARVKLILNRVAWTAFMSVLLRMSGFGVGPVELILWGVLFVVGWVYLGRSSRAPGTAV